MQRGNWEKLKKEKFNQLTKEDLFPVGRRGRGRTKGNGDKRTQVKNLYRTDGDVLVNM